MADSTNPNAGKNTSASFLPRFYRTDSNKKFLQATVEQLIQPGKVQKINGFIGRQNAKATTGDDIFIAAADSFRQRYQLEPSIVVKDSLDNTTFFKDYQDYINQLSVFGSNTSNHARLNKQEFYSWDPHINWDKFVNFQNYYWLPFGPDAIKIAGQAKKIASTYTVKLEAEGDSYEYVFTPNGLTRDPTVKLYRGQTYTFEINSPGNPFSIKTARSSGSNDRYTTVGLESAIEVGTITFTVPFNAPSVLYYQSETDVDLGGVFHILTIADNTAIDVDAEIIGKKNYTLADGTPLSNGMKVSFIGNVTPTSYASGQYYVEGVGDAISLINESILELVSTYTVSETILFDSTPFDGQPLDASSSLAKTPDYIVINRASGDTNPWSRYNRWFHSSVIEASAKINGTTPVLDQSARAVRPIIEFDAGLKLFNFGTTALFDIDLIDTYTTDVFSTIEGSLGYNIDGVDLANGQRILFTADTDVMVANKVYQVEFLNLIVDNVQRRQIHLVEVGEPVLNQVALIHSGTANQGLMYWFNGASWVKAQQKISVNQPPLFDIVDNNGVSFGDASVYDGSTFTGTKLFSYKVGSGSADASLGFALSYKNIANIGDIVFNFNLATDTFIYKDIATVINKNTDVGYLIKVATDGVTSYVNGWQTSTVDTFQAAIRIYKNSNKVNNFDVDVYDDITALSDLVVRVYVNGTRLPQTAWQLVDAPVYKKVVLNSDIKTSDVLTIKSYAAQPVNANGYYELPVNLQNNPLNGDMVDFTLGEVINHVDSIIDNIDTAKFAGAYPGVSNLRDLGNVTSLGTKFVQHSGPASLSLYHITSETNNIIHAVEQARDDYTKFKRNFVAVAESLGVDTDTVSHVDLVLQAINKDKPKTFPYYFSDMVAYGASLKTVLPVVDYRIQTYPLSNVFSLDELSHKAVNVYHNTTQLLYGRDYTFSSQGFVIITAALQNDDTITIYEYESTDGCFVPETPTKLGIWPKYEPKLYLDTSLVTPRMMIQGHDGSQVLAYGDFRDDLILELEKRIYNNIKVKYDADIFDIYDIVPSYNRTNEYSISEFNDVLAPSFYKWTTLIDRDFTKPMSYDRTNTFTFNYAGHSAPDGRTTPGYWRGVYRWILDTDRPNICPWEMLGFTEEPTWWSTVYGSAPYTSDNLVMWQDIANGHVKEPGKPTITKTKFAKPFLMEHIPVDEAGNLISPLLSDLATGVITITTGQDFVFGDVSPIESAWRRSSHYPYGVLLSAMLLTPAKTFGTLLDRSRIVRNLTGQLIYKDTGLRIKPTDIILPSIYTSKTRIQTAGIINFLVDYILSDNLKSYDSYIYDLDNMTSKLSYRVGGFTSKEKFNLLLDSKTPLSTGSVFVPQEDYDIILNSSSPVKKITYSGVIITKLADGFEVKGYSKTQPFFKYYPWTQAGITINIGGISESFSTWTPGNEYAVGKVVKYGNKYYRVSVSHTATSAFDASKYQSLPSLPINGGRDANLRKRWDRSEVITASYGTKFINIQDVVDFLLGYGEYLKDQGFVFDDFNANLAQVSNWETSAKEFLFWTTQNWSTGEDKWTDWLPNVETQFGSIVRYNGDYYRAIRNSEASTFFLDEDFDKMDGLSTVGSSVISLSPAAAKLTFNAPLCVVDDIRNSFNGYEIYKVDGQPITPNFLNSYREDNAVSYTPSGSEGIYGASFYLIQKEQVVIINNSTMFNDTIYNPESGYKQDRIKVSGYISIGWYGAFDVPGFIFDQAKIQDWEPWHDYALGDIVKHKEFYYSANSFLVGSVSFEPTKWIKLSKKPTAGLLPNWTYKASQFEDFYSLDSDNFDLEQQKMAQHLIGYQKRQYLENIIQDDVSEFKFYQGMIIEKGTQNVLNKLFDVLSADGVESLKFHEEWALRVGQYGASSAFDNIEFVLDESLFKNNPQGIELVDANNQAPLDFVIRQTPNDVYLKPVGYNSAPWPLLKSNKQYLRTPGHVRSDEVKVSLKTIDDIVSQDVSTFKVGDYVWCAFDKISWNVYRYSDANITVVDASFANGTLTITADSLVSLPIDSYIGISQVTGFNGFYKVKSVTLNSFTVAATDIKVASPFTEQSKIIICKLTSSYATSIDDAVLPKVLKDHEMLWTSAPGDKWKTWTHSPVYSSSAVTNSNPADQLTYGRAIAVDAKSSILAVSTSLGQVITYLKAGPAVPWTQNQVVLTPFVSTTNGANNADIHASVLAISKDGTWLATGSPLASHATVVAKDGALVTDPLGSTLPYTAHGVVSLYKKDISNTYLLVSTFASTSPVTNEYFGASLAFDNNSLFIGASGYSNFTGKVYQLDYLSVVRQVASYNPNGSTGTTLVVNDTTGIATGMIIAGTGFISGQTVISVLDSTTLVISANPDTEPSGQFTFSTVAWTFNNDATTEGSAQNSYYGGVMSVSVDGSVLAVAAPGTREVFVTSRGNSYSLTNINPLFGSSVSVSSTGDYIAISSIMFDGASINQGAVLVFKNNDTGAELIQTITDASPEDNELFGSRVVFANDYKTLVIYSKNADTSTELTFTDGTTFDEASTRFVMSSSPNSGRVDIYDIYDTKWVFGESLPTTNKEGDAYGTSIAVAGSSILVSAPYAIDTGVESGQVYEYKKAPGTYSWTVLHEEISKPDVSKIKKAFLYNKSSNQLVSYLDVIDATQGKIPGIAESEIAYKAFYDPAVYSVGDSTVNVDDGLPWTVNQVGTLWWDLRTAKFLDSYDSSVVYRNSIWNTLATGASIDVYEWVSTTYLPDAWDTIADTEAGLAVGISGTSLYGNTVYSLNRRYDNISKTFKNTYYYWVKNKKTVPAVPGRNKSASDVANLIANPRGEGYKYLALTGANSFSLTNVSPLLKDQDVVLSVEYWTIDKTDQNIHSQWKMVSDDVATQLPATIEQKWFDSLCGKDQSERLVPDTSLPPKLRYGIESRPRQSMFVNRFEALKQVIEQANIVLAQNQIVTSKNISALESFDSEPHVIRGLYDTTLDTDAELRFASIGSFQRPVLNLVDNITNGRITGINIVSAGNGYLVAPYIEVVGSGTGAKIKAKINTAGQIIGAEIINAGVGYDSNTVLVIRDYSILVHSDSQSSGIWSIYSYDPTTKVWSRTQSQAYNTTNYWSLVDWYSTGYNQFSAIDYAVDTFVDLNSITTKVGELVKIRTTNSGTWLLLEKYADTASIDWAQSYKIVGSQNGTIQLSSALYEFANTGFGYDGALYDGGIFDNSASTELRIILNALKDDIFVNELRSAYLNLFFTTVRYVLSEQNYVDWVFKTSFIKATHNVGALAQPVTYKNDNLANFEDYVAEVKPYRTKIREYVSAYDKTDTSQLSMTDFDLQPVYENGGVTVIGTTVNNDVISVDDPAILSYPWKHWKDNVGFVVTALTLYDSGSGYVNEPVVRIISESGTGATARAFITNGKVTRVVLLTSGTGYLSAPTIVLDGGLGVGGVAGKAVAIIGDSVIRSSLIKMKFDRITSTYFITKLQETETFTGTGSRLQFPLKWAPDVRIGQTTVTINGVDALRDSYTLKTVKSTSKGYTSYTGSIIFDSAIAKDISFTITYLKDWSLLNAADRIQYYYNPEAGMLGKDLAQLMTGVDYGGVIVNGLGFEVASGWGSLPYYSDKWDTFDATFDDYIVTVDADTYSFTLPYTPELGTELNFYVIKKNVDAFVSDGETLTYSFTFNDDAPRASIARTVPTTGTNVAGSFTLTLDSTFGLTVGEVVTASITGVLGYNTVITRIVNNTQVILDQILFADIPAGTDMIIGRDLISPTDVVLNTNGTLELSVPVPLGTILYVTGTLPSTRLDDPFYGTVDQTNPYAIMLPVTIDSGNVGTRTFTIPNTITVGAGDKFIIRKSTSDGSIKPQESDYDTALSGGNTTLTAGDYNTATGLAAEDIIIDGDGFVTPTSSPATEEVVPGQVVDTVAIKVYDQPSSGSAHIKVDNFIADGIRKEFPIGQTPNSSQAVIVKSAATIMTVDVDYTIDYATKTISFVDAPADKAIVSLFSFGFSGTGILDLDYFVADGITSEFVTKAPWLSAVTSLTYIDGVPSAPELFKTDTTYEATNRIGFRFADVPPAGAIINFVIVSGSTQTFAVTKTEQIAVDGRLASVPYELVNKIGDSLPNESSMLVRVDQQILTGPNNSYFTIGSNRLTYSIDSAKFLPYSVDVNSIVVLADGKLLTPGNDYVVDLAGISVKINRVVYKAYTGKELIISVTQGQSYTYTPPTATELGKILFTESYNAPQLVEVISSYKHDVMDIQRTEVNVTTSLALTPDTLQYYSYRGIAAGNIPLDRAVIDDNYIWVVKNGSLLTPSVDFKLNDDKQSIKLAAIPAVTDEFALITYGSNVLTNGIAYMQFKDMLNRTHFKRLSLNKQTKLAVDLHFSDVTITVEDASNFDLPNPANNKPGVIEIRGERIEFFTINGNVLSQLRRGTLGTGTPLVHTAGTYVQEIGPSETIPYADSSVVEQFFTDGSRTIPLTFAPASVNDIEVFVGGYDTTSVWAPNVAYAVDTIVTIGSYTYRCVTAHTSSSVFDSANWAFFIGNIRLKKHAYDVYNVNVAPESPEGDVQFSADFTVDGVSKEIVLTNALTFGTMVTVVKRTGVVWDSTINIQHDTSKIARFLKVTPGVWYTNIQG